MKPEKDQVVGQIYQSWDYDKFNILPENRGLKDSNGVDRRKVAQIQRLIDEDQWVDEESIVKVNENFTITQGAHNFIVRKNNGMPIRYVIVRDHRFNNGTSRRQLVNNILGTNTIDTSWKKAQVFAAAYYTKCKLALLIHELIENHENRFRWQEIMGIITKYEDFFNGYHHHRVLNLDIFCDKDYIEYFNSPAFKAEFDYFLKLNDKFRIAARKGLLLKAAYSIINRCKEDLDIRLFMKTLLTIDDKVLNSHQIKNFNTCIVLMINHYNKVGGKKVEPSAVRLQIKMSIMEENEKRRAKDKRKRELVEVNS